VTGTEDLSFAFLESHPADAARVLERIAPRHVAALLADVPLRLAAPVLQSMLPLQAARCLEMLDDDTAAGLLRALGLQAGVAVLHYVPDARRNRLLAQLPTAQGIACRLLLGYPEDSVGAWMDPRVPALPADTTVESAIRRLREAIDEDHAGIFVIGDGQRLLGHAGALDLLRAPADATLDKVMGETAFTIPARATLRAVETHAGWARSQILPVVEREDRFVGALDRGVLAQALLRERRAPAGGNPDSVLANATSAWWLGVAGLIQLAVSLLPVTPHRPGGDTGEH